MSEFRSKDETIAGMFGMTNGKMANYLTVRAVIESIATLDPKDLHKMLKYYKVDDPDDEIVNDVYNQLLNFTYILDRMTELPTVSLKGSNTFLSVFDEFIT